MYLPKRSYNTEESRKVALRIDHNNVKTEAVVEKLR